MGLVELGYVGFAVSDLAAWDRFADEVLGLDVGFGPQGDTRLLRLDDRMHRIILVEGADDDITFAGWRVGSLPGLEEFARHLDRQGIAWTEGSPADLALRNVDRMIHFADPDGNRHEAFAGLPAGNAPFVSAKVTGGYITGEGGLGHIVYGCDDYPGMIRFARDVLGMKMSDTIDQTFGMTTVEVSFLHLNERHHSIAFSNRKGAKTLHHFLLETARIEDVGLGWERHRASGLPIAQNIGQHPNDRMISYYGATPSGFLIELGWGVVKIDDASWEVGHYPRFSDWGHHASVA